MAFDWNKYEKVSPEKSGDSTFDWSKHPTVPSEQSQSAQEAPPEIGSLEAGTRGAAAGMTLGLSPRIAAAAETLGDVGKPSFDWSGNYNKYLDIQRQREAASKDQHPILYHGAEFGVPMAIPFAGALKGAGALAEGANFLNLPSHVAEAGGALAEAIPGAAKFAESSPMLAGIAKHAAQGAAIGGVAGAANSEDLGNTSNTLENAASGAKMGAALGGALGTVGAGVRGVAKSVQNSNGILNGIFGNSAELLTKGLDQEDLSNFDKISKQVYDYGQITGDKILIQQSKNISAQFEKALQNASEEGKKTDLKDLFTYLEQAKSDAQKEADPDKLKAVNMLYDRYMNQVYGQLQKMEWEVPTMTERTIPGQEAVPSTMDTLQAKAAKMSADEMSNSKLTNQPPKRYEVTPDNQNGQPVLGIKETVPATAEQGEQVNPPKQWMNAAEGTPAVPESKTIDTTYNTETSMERPGTPGGIGASDLADIEKYLGGKSATAQKGLQAGNVDMSGPAEVYAGADKIVSKMVDEMMPDRINAIDSTTDEVIPGYGTARAKWASLVDAMKKAGIQKSSMLDKNLQNIGEAQLNELKPQIMKDLGDQVALSLNPDQAGLLAKQNLDVFFQYLKKSGVQDADQIRAQLEQNMHNLKLSGLMHPDKIPSGLASANPKVMGLSFLSSLGPNVAHNAGLLFGNKAIQAGVNVAPGLAAAQLAPSNPLARPGANKEENSASTVTGSADSSISPMANFSSKLSYSNPEQSKQVSTKLKSDPNLSYLGDALDKAIQSGNQIQKNAIIFAISQNPNARKLLGVEAQK